MWVGRDESVCVGGKVGRWTKERVCVKVPNACVYTGRRREEEHQVLHLVACSQSLQFQLYFYSDKLSSKLFSELKLVTDNLLFIH